jgi:hypothetical protein
MVALRGLRLIIAATLSIALSVTMTGCSQSPSESASSSSNGGLHLGKPAFQFDPKHVVALSLVKADPRSSDHWSARVARAQDNPKSFYDSDPWQIQSFSGGDILDHAANRGWILHFIDTLTTYRPETKLDISPDSKITPEVRANYGLNPPRYEIQWQVIDPETQKISSFELQIGNGTTPVHDSNPANSDSSDGESFAIFPPHTDIYRANGASMAMLDFLKNFTTLRQETLSPLDSDDVDEIHIEKPHTKPFYAQRDGDRWTDEKHHPIKADVAGFLDRVTHLRILQFVDDAAQAQMLKKSLASAHDHTVITFTDRYSHPVQLTFGKIKDVPVATVSTRGDAVFDLYPGSPEKLALH